jgi:FAD:protein FMN transferase
LFNTLKPYLARYSFTLGFLALFFLWLWLRPQPPTQIYQLSGATMGTTYNILVAGFPDTISDNELAQGIEQRLYRLDRELMSTYAPDSELSRFNRSEPGEWVDVAPELAFVVAQALEFSELTAGSFDVTVGPLVDRWGFGPTPEGSLSWTRIPTEDELQALKDQIGYQYLQVRLQPPQLRKLKAVRVDLSGIAKGYGADVIADYFDSVGQESYFIEIGGELRIRGLKPDGSPWVPALERPGEGTRVQAVIKTNGQPLALAGSGDYRNYFVENGQRFSHEIDPFSGRPISHNLAAVYVIADTATTADALTTAFIVMGLERSLALAERIGLAAYFIVKSEGPDEFEIFMSSHFAPFLEDTL